MAKKKAANKENKSDFLRRVVREDPRLSFHEINLRWAAAGHAGEISSALYNRVRADVAIQLMEERARPVPNETPRMPQPLPVVIYQFKITLLGVLPLVWRRIQVRDCSLATFHEHIQNAMGWADTHQHHFVIDGILYGCQMVLGATFTERRYWRTLTTDLRDVLPKDGSRSRFEYEYDFESSWQHEILFEGCPPAGEANRYPLCVEGERACPPEDVGGLAGYADFLRIITDPGDPRHLEVRQSVGRPFDAEAFDPGKTTLDMKWRRSTPSFERRRR
jgi:hypothetical protein